MDIEHLTWRRALLIGRAAVRRDVAGHQPVDDDDRRRHGRRAAPRQAAEFSFLLGLPTLGGACVYSRGEATSLGDGPTMIEVLGVEAARHRGFAVATISAAIAVKWLVRYLSKHGLAIFGWYRLALSAVLILLIQAGALRIAPSEPTARAQPSRRLRRSKLQHEIAVADRDRLAQQRREQLSQLADRGVAGTELELR